MEKIIINRRKPGILCDGFQYRIHREANSSRTWRCTKKECKATCTTDLSDLMVLDGRFEHNHPELDERDRFKDIKFVKSAKARPRMNQEKDRTRLL